MARNPYTFTLPESGVSVTLRGRLTLGDVRRWVQAEQEGDLDTIVSYIARVVDAWDLDGDPKDVTSYDALDIADFAALQRTVLRYARGEYDGKN